GAVYLAQDLQLQRLVAIKVLPPELAVRPELRERFLRETRLAAGFSHPNIVAVHAVEDHPQLLAFVMGFVEGETLGQRVRRAGPLHGAEAVRMLQEVAWALSYAHGRGVVHRDIKPDNILVERATGRALLTDFGIARSSAAGVSHLTQVGEVVGTPQFMSPEQAAGEPLDGRSDLYSLGVVAFFAVTGRLPFEASSAGAVMAMHLTQTPPRVASLRPDLPQALCAAIDRCLEKDPAQRFESGEALAAALDPIRSARREVSPALRMFQLQATQTIRVLLIVTLIGSTMFRSVISEDEGMAMIFGVIAITVMWAVVAQIVGRARYLLTAGYTFEEVREGLGVIVAERDEARAQELANPRARQREAARMRVMIISFLLSISGTWLVLTFIREKVGEHSYHTGILGLSILAVCASLFGIAIALLMMNPARSSAIDKQIARLWRGRVGRAVFRLAGWHLEREATHIQDELRSLETKRRALESALAVVSSEVRAAETKSGG
ncbi:MAG TPA: serine/threonine-protein kinase, partial [Gemmatimonadaceae bacterium]|nr:serine/threonine-protein kinase [Gemmatimonadaceae bacterium]